MLNPATITYLNQARSKRQEGYGRKAIVLKPDLNYAKRCAAQLPPGRRQRFLKNVGLA